MSKNEISEEAADEIKAMYKIIGEMESLGDSGEAIGRILKRKNAHNKVFDKSILDRLGKMMDLVQKSYDVMIANLKNIDFEDLTQVLPTALMLISMPVSGSIGHGIGLGMISFTAIKLFTGKGKEVSAVTYIISALFLIKFFAVV